MSRRVLGSLSLTLGLALLLAQSLVGPLSASHLAPRDGAAITPAQRAAITTNYGRLPLTFEQNEGQLAGPARFLVHGSGYTLALTPSEALLVLAHGTSASTAHSRVAVPGQPALFAGPSGPRQPPDILGMQWLGANPNSVVTGEQQLPGTVNYFIGNDPAQWHTNIPTYQQVRLHDVYPGVDLVYYGTNGQLEYDFVVAPGANPGAIHLSFTGEARLGVDLLGNLSLSLPSGTIAQEKPLIYQSVNGARQTVAGGYVLASGGRVGFTLGRYNPRLPLVIDPAYKFSTYLGGSGIDQSQGIALDSSGNAYITGNSYSTNFPTTAGAFQTVNHSSTNGNTFVSKLNASGTALVYSTYVGGSGGDYANGIALDSSGDAYIAGYTYSTNFPTTVGAFQTTDIGDPSGFVTKLNAAGSALVYSTYLSGSGNDGVDAIAVDSSGAAYVSGNTNATNFPTTAGAFQTVNHGSTYGTGFVTKLNASGAALSYSTFLGGSGFDAGRAVALDSAGDAYVTGFTSSTDFPTTASAFQTTNHSSGADSAFATRLNATGSALVYSSYLGGSIEQQGTGIAVDASDNAYITGYTSSTNFPTTAGAFQTTNLSGGTTAYVTKFNPTGTALAYSTYLGGTSFDQGNAITVDSGGSAYVTGYTSSPDFPTVNPVQASLGGGGSGTNVFVSAFNAAGSALTFSTYLGGSTFPDCCGDQGFGIALAANATVYVTGGATSSDFPTSHAIQATYAGSEDAFVTEIDTHPSLDTTTGVFRPSNGVLYLKNANTTGPADISLNYGQSGDQPITGDWTGKGYKSIGVYRNGTFYLRNSNTTGYANIVVPFGNSTDIPVAGDWTNKGYDSIGVYRPSTNTFLLRNSNTSGPADITARLGISGDVPIVGDWTGQGKDTIGVFRPSNGITYLRNSNTTGYANIAFTYGIAGDKPVVGDWDHNGTDTIGVDRGGNFLLRNSNSTGPANLSFYLGVSGDDPIAGPWLPPPSSPPPVHHGPSTPAPHTATTRTRRTAPARH